MQSTTGNGNIRGIGPLGWRAVQGLVSSNRDVGLIYSFAFEAMGFVETKTVMWSNCELVGVQSLATYTRVT